MKASPVSSPSSIKGRATKNVYWRDEQDCGAAKPQITIVTTSGVTAGRVSGSRGWGRGAEVGGGEQTEAKLTEAVVLSGKFCVLAKERAKPEHCGSFATRAEGEGVRPALCSSKQS